MAKKKNDLDKQMMEFKKNTDVFEKGVNSATRGVWKNTSELDEMSSENISSIISQFQTKAINNTMEGIMNGQKTFNPSVNTALQKEVEKLMFFDYETIGKGKLLSPTQLSVRVGNDTKTFITKIKKETEDNLRRLITDIESGTKKDLELTEDEKRDLLSLADFSTTISKDGKKQVAVKHKTFSKGMRITANSPVFKQIKEGLEIASSSRSDISGFSTVAEIEKYLADNLAKGITAIGHNVRNFDANVAKSQSNKIFEALSKNVADTIEIARKNVSLGTKSQKTGKMLLGYSQTELAKWLDLDLRDIAMKTGGTQHTAEYDTELNKRIFEGLRKEIQTVVNHETKQLKAGQFGTAKKTHHRQRSGSFMVDLNKVTKNNNGYLNPKNNSANNFLFVEGNDYIFEGISEAVKQGATTYYAKFRNLDTNVESYLEGYSKEEIQNVINDVFQGSFKNQEEYNDESTIRSLFKKNTGGYTASAIVKNLKGEKVTDRQNQRARVVKKHSGLKKLLLSIQDDLLDPSMSSEAKNVAMNLIGKQLGVIQDGILNGKGILNFISDTRERNVSSFKTGFIDFINSHDFVESFDKKGLIKTIQDLQMSDLELSTDDGNFRGIANILSENLKVPQISSTKAQQFGSQKNIQMAQGIMKNVKKSYASNQNGKKMPISAMMSNVNKDILSGQYVIDRLKNISRKDMGKTSSPYALVKNGMGSNSASTGYSVGSVGHYINLMQETANKSGLGMHIAERADGSGIKIGFYDARNESNYFTTNDKGDLIADMARMASVEVGLADKNGVIRNGNMNMANHFIADYDSNQGIILHTVQEEQLKNIARMVGSKRFKETILGTDKRIGSTQDAAKLLSNSRNDAFSGSPTGGTYIANSSDFIGSKKAGASVEQMAQRMNTIDFVPALRAIAGQINQQAKNNGSTEEIISERNIGQILDIYALNAHNALSAIQGDKTYSWAFNNSGELSNFGQRVISEFNKLNNVLPMSFAGQKEDSFLGGYVSTFDSRNYSPFADLNPSSNRAIDQGQARLSRTDYAKEIIKKTLMSNIFGSIYDKTFGLTPSDIEHSLYNVGYVDDIQIKNLTQKFIDKKWTKEKNNDKWKGKNKQDYINEVLGAFLPSVYDGSALISGSLLSSLDMYRSQVSGFGYFEDLKNSKLFSKAELEKIQKMTEGTSYDLEHQMNKDFIFDGKQYDRGSVLRNISLSGGKYKLTFDKFMEMKSGMKGIGDFGQRNTIHSISDELFNYIANETGNQGANILTSFSGKDKNIAELSGGRVKYLLSTALKNGGNFQQISDILNNPNIQFLNKYLGVDKERSMFVENAFLGKDGSFKYFDANNQIQNLFTNSANMEQMMQEYTYGMSAEDLKAYTGQLSDIDILKKSLFDAGLLTNKQVSSTVTSQGFTQENSDPYFDATGAVMDAEDLAHARTKVSGREIDSLRRSIRLAEIQSGESFSELGKIVDSYGSQQVTPEIQSQISSYKNAIERNKNRAKNVNQDESNVIKLVRKGVDETLADNEISLDVLANRANIKDGTISEQDYQNSTYGIINRKIQELGWGNIPLENIDVQLDFSGQGTSEDILAQIPYSSFGKEGSGVAQFDKIHLPMLQARQVGDRYVSQAYENNINRVIRTLRGDEGTEHLDFNELIADTLATTENSVFTKGSELYDLAHKFKVGHSTAIKLGATNMAQFGESLFTKDGQANGNFILKSNAISNAVALNSQHLKDMLISQSKGAEKNNSQKLRWLLNNMFKGDEQGLNKLLNGKQLSQITKEDDLANAIVDAVNVSGPYKKSLTSLFNRYPSSSGLDLKGVNVVADSNITKGYSKISLDLAKNVNGDFDGDTSYLQLALLNGDLNETEFNAAYDQLQKLQTMDAAISRRMGEYDWTEYKESHQNQDQNLLEKRKKAISEAVPRIFDRIKDGTIGLISKKNKSLVGSLSNRASGVRLLTDKKDFSASGQIDAQLTRAIFEIFEQDAISAKKVGDRVYSDKNQEEKDIVSSLQNFYTNLAAGKSHWNNKTENKWSVIADQMEELGLVKAGDEKWLGGNRQIRKALAMLETVYGTDVQKELNASGINWESGHINRDAFINLMTRMEGNNWALTSSMYEEAYGNKSSRVDTVGANYDNADKKQREIEEEQKRAALIAAKNFGEKLLSGKNPVDQARQIYMEQAEQIGGVFSDASIQEAIKGKNASFFGSYFSNLDDYAMLQEAILGKNIFTAEDFKNSKGLGNIELDEKEHKYRYTDGQKKGQYINAITFSKISSLVKSGGTYESAASSQSKNFIIDNLINSYFNGNGSVQFKMRENEQSLPKEYIAKSVDELVSLSKDGQFRTVAAHKGSTIYGNMVHKMLEGKIKMQQSGIWDSGRGLEQLLDTEYGNFVKSNIGAYVDILGIRDARTGMSSKLSNSMLKSNLEKSVISSATGMEFLREEFLQSLGIDVKNNANLSKRFAETSLGFSIGTGNNQKTFAGTLDDLLLTASNIAGSTSLNDWKTTKDFKGDALSAQLSFAIQGIISNAQELGLSLEQVTELQNMFGKTLGQSVRQAGNGDIYSHKIRILSQDEMARYANIISINDMLGKNVTNGEVENGILMQKENPFKEYYDIFQGMTVGQKSGAASLEKLTEAAQEQGFTVKRLTDASNNLVAKFIKLDEVTGRTATITAKYASGGKQFIDMSVEETDISETFDKNGAVGRILDHQKALDTLAELEAGYGLEGLSNKKKKEKIAEAQRKVKETSELRKIALYDYSEEEIQQIENRAFQSEAYKKQRMQHMANMNLSIDDSKFDTYKQLYDTIVKTIEAETQLEIAMLNNDGTQESIVKIQQLSQAHKELLQQIENIKQAKSFTVDSNGNVVKSIENILTDEDIQKAQDAAINSDAVKSSMQEREKARAKYVDKNNKNTTAELKSEYRSQQSEIFEYQKQLVDIEAKQAKTLKSGLKYEEFEKQKEAIRQRMAELQKLIYDAGNMYRVNEDGSKEIASGWHMTKDEQRKFESDERSLNRKRQFELEQKKTQYAKKGYFSQLKDSVSSSFKYMMIGQAGYMVIGKVRQAINSVIVTTKELDKTMTNLQIVTGKNYKEVNQLVKGYSALAKEIGGTTQEVSASANEWLRMGYSTSEVNTLITNSMMLSKLGMIESAKATEYLISAMKGYGIAVADSSKIVDMATALDMKYAVSSGYILEAMSKTAASAKLAKVEMSDLQSMIAIVGETTQKDASVIGESFKTAFARYGNVKAGVFSNGTSSATMKEDGTAEDNSTFENVNDIEKVLSTVNISLREKDLTTWRSYSDILKEVGTSWSKYTDYEKNAITTALFGTRQRENGLVVLENYNRVLDAQAIAISSTGTASKKYEAYQNSLEAATNRLKSAWEALILKLEASGTIKNVSKLLEFLVEHIGAVTTALTTLLVATNLEKAIVGLTKYSMLFNKTMGKFTIGTFKERGQKIKNSFKDGWKEADNIAQRDSKEQSVEERSIQTMTTLNDSILKLTAAVDRNTASSGGIPSAGLPSGTKNPTYPTNTSVTDLVPSVNGQNYPVVTNAGNSLVPFVYRGEGQSSDDTIRLNSSQWREISSRRKGLHGVKDWAKQKIGSGWNTVKTGTNKIITKSNEWLNKNPAANQQIQAATSIYGMIGGSMIGSEIGKVMGNEVIGGIAGTMLGPTANAIGTAIGGPVGGAIAGAVTGVVGTVWKIYSDYQEKMLQKAKEALAELEGKYTSITSKETTDKVNEYEQLVKGVDSTGANISLSSDEYQRFLDISNDLGSIFPSLIARTDAYGNSLLGVDNEIGSITDNISNLAKEYQKATDEKILDKSIVGDKYKTAVEELDKLDDTTVAKVNIVSAGQYSLGNVNVKGLSETEIEELNKYLYNKGFSSGFDKNGMHIIADESLKKTVEEYLNNTKNKTYNDEKSKIVLDFTKELMPATVRSIIGDSATSEQISIANNIVKGMDLQAFKDFWSSRGGAETEALQEFMNSAATVVDLDKKGSLGKIINENINTLNYSEYLKNVKGYFSDVETSMKNNEGGYVDEFITTVKNLGYTANSDNLEIRDFSGNIIDFKTIIGKMIGFDPSTLDLASKVKEKIGYNGDISNLEKMTTSQLKTVYELTKPEIEILGLENIQDLEKIQEILESFAPKSATENVNSLIALFNQMKEDGKIITSLNWDQIIDSGKLEETLAKLKEDSMGKSLVERLTKQAKELNIELNDLLEDYEMLADIDAFGKSKTSLSDIESKRDQLLKVQQELRKTGTLTPDNYEILNNISPELTVRLSEDNGAVKVAEDIESFLRSGQLSVQASILNDLYNSKTEFTNITQNDTKLSQLFGTMQGAQDIAQLFGLSWNNIINNSDYGTSDKDLERYLQVYVDNYNEQFRTSFTTAAPDLQKHIVNTFGTAEQKAQVANASKEQLSELVFAVITGVISGLNTMDVYEPILNEHATQMASQIDLNQKQAKIDSINKGYRDVLDAKESFSDAEWSKKNADIDWEEAKEDYAKAERDWKKAQKAWSKAQKDYAKQNRRLAKQARDQEKKEQLQELTDMLERRNLIIEKYNKKISVFETGAELLDTSDHEGKYNNLNNQYIQNNQQIDNLRTSLEALNSVTPTSSEQASKIAEEYDKLSSSLMEAQIKSYQLKQEMNKMGLTAFSEHLEDVNNQFERQDKILNGMLSILEADTGLLSAWDLVDLNEFQPITEDNIKDNRIDYNDMLREQEQYQEKSLAMHRQYLDILKTENAEENAIFWEDHADSLADNADRLNDAKDSLDDAKESFNDAQRAFTNAEHDWHEAQEDWEKAVSDYYESIINFEKEYGGSLAEFGINVESLFGNQLLKDAHNWMKARSIITEEGDLIEKAVSKLGGTYTPNSPNKEDNSITKNDETNDIVTPITPNGMNYIWGDDSPKNVSTTSDSTSDKDNSDIVSGTWTYNSSRQKVFNPSKDGKDKAKKQYNSSTRAWEYVAVNSSSSTKSTSTKSGENNNQIIIPAPILDPAWTDGSKEKEIVDSFTSIISKAKETIESNPQLKLSIDDIWNFDDITSEKPVENASDLPKIPEIKPMVEEKSSISDKILKQITDNIKDLNVKIEEELQKVIDKCEIPVPKLAEEWTETISNEGSLANDIYTTSEKTMKKAIKTVEEDLKGTDENLKLPAPELASEGKRGWETEDGLQGRIVKKIEQIYENIGEKDTLGILTVPPKLDEEKWTSFGEEIAKYISAGIDNALDREASVDSNQLTIGGANETGSSNVEYNIKKGQTVYFRTGSKEGHVGVYDGNGNVYHLAGPKGQGTVLCQPFSHLANKYEFLAAGWNGGMELNSQQADDVIALASTYNTFGRKNGQCQAWVADLISNATNTSRVSYNDPESIVRDKKDWLTPLTSMPNIKLENKTLFSSLLEHKFKDLMGDELPEDYTGSISDNAKVIWEYLLKRNFNKKSIAAIIGNFVQESGLNPNITNSIGAFGFAQWLGSRKENLFKKYGNSPSIFDQLEFLIWELENTEKKSYNVLKNADKYTLDELTVLFRKLFERPAEWEANDKRRINAANLYYNMFANSYANGTSSLGHQGGLALVGDENFLKGSSKPAPEVGIYPNGSMELLGQHGAELRNLPKGTHVIPANITNDILQGVPSYANGVGDSIGIGISDSIKDATNDVVDAIEDLNDTVFNSKTELIKYAKEKYGNNAELILLLSGIDDISSNELADEKTYKLKNIDTDLMKEDIWTLITSKDRDSNTIVKQDKALLEIAKQKIFTNYPDPVQAQSKWDDYMETYNNWKKDVNNPYYINYLLDDIQQTETYTSDRYRLSHMDLSENVGKILEKRRDETENYTESQRLNITEQNYINDLRADMYKQQIPIFEEKYQQAIDLVKYLQNNGADSETIKEALSTAEGIREQMVEANSTYDEILDSQLKLEAQYSEMVHEQKTYQNELLDVAANLGQVRDLDYDQKIINNNEAIQSSLLALAEIEDRIWKEGINRGWTEEKILQEIANNTEVKNLKKTINSTIQQNKEILKAKYDDKVRQVERDIQKNELKKPEEWKTKTQITDFYNDASDFYDQEILYLEEYLAEAENLSIEEYEETIDKINDLRDKNLQNEIQKMSDLVQYQESIYEALKYRVNEYIDDLELEKEAVSERYDEEIDKLTKVNEDKERSIKLSELQQKLDNAEKQKKRVYRAGVGFVYESDRSEVKSARQELDSFWRNDKINDLKTAKDIEIKFYDERIQGWRKYIDGIEKETKRFEAAQNHELLMRELGVDTLEELDSKLIKDRDNFLIDYDFRNSVYGEYNTDYTGLFDNFLDKYERYLEKLDSLQKKELSLKRENYNIYNDERIKDYDDLAMSSTEDWVKFRNKYNIEDFAAILGDPEKLEYFNNLGYSKDEIAAMRARKDVDMEDFVTKKDAKDIVSIIRGSAVNDSPFNDIELLQSLIRELSYEGKNGNEINEIIGAFDKSRLQTNIGNLVAKTQTQINTSEDLKTVSNNILSNVTNSAYWQYLDNDTQNQIKGIIEEIATWDIEALGVNISSAIGEAIGNISSLVQKSDKGNSSSKTTFGSKTSPNSLSSVSSYISSSVSEYKAKHTNSSGTYTGAAGYLGTVSEVTAMGYAEGSDGTTSRSFLAGEEGPEVGVYPDGTSVIYGTNGPEIYENEPLGTTIFTAEESSKILGMYKNGTMNKGLAKFTGFSLDSLDYYKYLMNKTSNMPEYFSTIPKHENTNSQKGDTIYEIHTVELPNVQDPSTFWRELNNGVQRHKKNR